MTVNSSRNALKRRTWALFMFFFLPGLLMASWATRTPAIRDILSVSIAEMGGVLFGLSIGSMSGILCSAWLVKRFGTRNVILVTMSCALIGMMILSLALWLTSPLLFAVGLGVFGASFGSAEVAINVEGAAVEREMNKTVLPMMHGFIAWHAGRRWCRDGTDGLWRSGNGAHFIGGAGRHRAYLYRHSGNP